LSGGLRTLFGGVSDLAVRVGVWLAFVYVGITFRTLSADR
jgi:hypothetical protein